MGYFWVKMCFGVSSCSWTTFIFMIPWIVTFEFNLIFGSFCLFGPNGLILWSEYALTTDLGSTHKVEQFSFSVFPSILTFDFDLILGSFFIFWGALMGYFWFEVGFNNSFGVLLCSWTTFIFIGEGLEKFLGSIHIAEQLSFSMFPSIRKLDFELILGSF